MATLVLQAAGGFIGGFLGPVGAAIGTAAGAMAGYAIDRALIDSTRRIEGPRLTGARPYSAEEGAPLPRVYGTARIGGTLIWATRFEESRTTKRQGGKGGGPKVTEYSYFVNAAFALCEGEIAGIRRIWADGRELDRDRVDLRIYNGSGDQMPDPLIEAKQGSGNSPAYRGTAYVVLDRLPIGDYGNRIPQLQFEVLRPVGKVAQNIRAVALIPGSTEFGLSPYLVTREISRGDTEAINRHVLHAATDLTASLDELQSLCPNLEHIALVATWFGNDLRAGACTIRPAVTDHLTDGFSQPWKVSGLTRDAAPLVSRHEGSAAYGGSPSDLTVIDAIKEIKRRGLKVTLYPFVMMDIPADNALPDPYGKAAQASYPWRGRISCHPAPLQPASADRTAAARTQIAAFCGTAQAANFTTDVAAVAFNGQPGDWGYRRFVLHFAHLAAAAGGVDAFLVGSELRGLTTVRDQNNAFPFVEQLCDLAGQARTILGAATRITYAADWSEYFGHHPQDGSGDVFFHLDLLWSHPAVDAIGIDNYMPLSDWRDEDMSGGNPDAFAGPYDPDGLRRAVQGGEGFDWYYPSETARNNRQRASITDGAHGKPWVFRYKDIAGWWSNLHHNRIGGQEAAQPTAWIPRSKPVWFTEIGCPAVDKGPNQPNVFPDPKSAESASPYFSNGGRSDLAVERYLAAHSEFWDPASPHFVASGNPLSPLYGGCMVDPSRLYVWAWDARPFPAFPLTSGVWRDGENWRLGHWLNGRLSGLTCGDLINAVLADHGLPAADVSNADGTMHGYLVSDPASARATLEPVIDLYGLAVCEVGGKLVFRREGMQAAPVAVTELVVEGDSPMVDSTRTPDHHLPVEAILGFRDPLNDYQTASARERREGAAGQRQETISFAGMLETGEAQALLDDWLRRAWSQRETIAFAVPSPDASVEPGTVVRLPDVRGDSEFLVTDVEDGLIRRVSARQLVRALPSAWNGSLPPTLPAPVTIAGRSHALFLDLPMPPGGGNACEQFRVAVWNRSWRSQLAFASPEATGFSQRASIVQPATVGQLVEALGAGFDGRVDRGGAVIVKLSDGELASASRLQMLNGANIAAIRSATGVWELIQFETAEEIQPAQWRLSGLLRGQLGTTDAMFVGAPIGADFVLIDDAVRSAGLLPSECGLSLNWRVGPAGYEFSADNFMQQSQTGGIRASLPLAPVHLRGKRSLSGDLAISWIRRGRIDADSWLPAEIPLGEETESYRISIGPVGGTPIRTVTSSVSNWLYQASQIAADFSPVPPEIEVSVSQLSATVGWGLEARRRLSLL